MSHVLQHLVMPNLAFGAPVSMYARTGRGDVFVLLKEKRIDFLPGGRAVFDTYFNGLSVEPWRRHCAIGDLYLALRGRGRFVVRIGLHRSGQAQRWLDEQSVDLREDRVTVIPIPAWEKLDAGMLYFSLQARAEGCLLGGYFATTSEPPNRVRLGVVITHFNRKKYVLPAIARLSAELLDDPAYRGRIELVVVDNSSNIERDEAGGATLLPNRNLGGSGGFMRGLLHLKDQGAFTHCLFMDDDASCEIESIRRAYALLCHARTPRFAVSGSLLRELEPQLLFEKGARFDVVCESLKSGLNMLEIGDLLRAESVEKRPDYGAWWFFAFALADVRHYAFPFFVRGDDILFGLLNRFEIATLNGIGCWGEDFSYKSSPITKYLDVRSHIVQWCAAPAVSRWTAAAFLARFFLTALFSFNYASARAARLAIAHVRRGREWWSENLDMAAIRAEIERFSEAEKMRPVQRSQHRLHLAGEIRPESFAARLLRIATLNGFLVPTPLLRREVVFQNKGFRAVFRQIFMCRAVLYEYEPGAVGYLARHDKKAFFGELAAFCWQMAGFVLRYGSLRKRYRDIVEDLTREGFWRGVYRDAAAPALPPGPEKAAPPRGRETAMLRVLRKTWAAAPAART